MKETGKIYSVRIVFARSGKGNNKTNFYKVKREIVSWQMSNGR